MESRELAGRIAEYRVRAGLTQQELAREAGMDRTALAKIETGQRRVTALELDALADALDVRIEWFFHSPAEALVAYRTALDPEAPTSSIDHYLERLSRDVDFVIDLASTRFSELRGAERGLDSRADVEALARQARGWMGVAADEPIMRFAEVAATAGVLIFSIDLGPDAPEAASVLSERAGVAIVNGHLKVGRRRLAAAHELGHILTRDGYRVDWRVDSPDQDRWEVRLDRFARALLLPETAVRTAWTTRYDGGTREAAIRIASTFQVDMATLARRLSELDLASASDAGVVRGISTGAADIIGYDLVVRNDLDAPSAPRSYQQAVLQLYQADKITASRAVDLLIGTLGEDELPPRPSLPEGAAWNLL